MSDGERQSDFDSDELWTLLEAQTNERLTEVQHDRLQTILRDNRGAQEMYLAYVDLNLGLNLAHHQSWLPHMPVPDHQTVPRPARRVSKRPQSPSYWLMLSSALAACVILGAVVTWVFMNPNRLEHAGPTGGMQASNHAPRLTQQAGARFLETIDLKVGDILAFNRAYTLREGLVEVSFSCGAKAIIEAPAIFKAADISTLAINIGDISVYAPTGAEGFTVKTPVASVVDQGTRFAVNVEESGQTSVQVIEGAVDVSHGGHGSHGRHGNHGRDGRDGRDAKPTNIHTARLTEGMANLYDWTDRKPIAFNRDRYLSVLPDRIVSYQAVNHDIEAGVDLLESVTVQRGGEMKTYQVNELIGVEAIHFKAGKQENSLITPLDVRDPGKGDPKVLRRTDMLSDQRLTSGVVNPGGAKMPLKTQAIMNDPEDSDMPNTPGLAVRFLTPVINRPGPDVVLFDLQVMVQTLEGDGFHVGPLTYREGLKTHSISRYDIDLTSPKALVLAAYWNHLFKKPPTSLNDYLYGHSGQRERSDVAKGLAVGIDLSDLGYAMGDTADGLFLQDDLADKNYVDPVFIGGFPAE